MIVFEKTYPSERNNIPQIENEIILSLEKINISDDKLMNISIALGEVISNSIEHGNQSEKDKNISVSVEFSNNQLKISSKDSGKGFEMDDVSDPTEDENIFNSRGRGIYILKSITDDLQFNFTEKGTETILIFNL